MSGVLHEAYCARLFTGLTPFVCFFGSLAPLASAHLAHGQTVPGDFAVVATAGGAFPGGSASYTRTIRIGANGDGEITAYRSGDLSADEPDPIPFSLSANEVDQLWQAVEANNFFDLQSSYANAGVFDRTFAQLVVTANGASHSVSTRNVAVEGFDNIVAAINLVTPGDDDLLYDTTLPFTFVPVAICEQTDKRGSSNVAANLPHPGSVVAYHMPLAEAVSKHAAQLSAKGEHYGDAVKIDVDNSGSITSNDLKLTIYIELWGSGASAGIAAQIESAVEMAWSGTTSDGKSFTVDVVTRVRPGGSDAPGTPGYHQIQMTPDSTYESDVHDAGEPFGANNGTAAGTWSSIGSDLEELYAHEAGHLFGLPDRYNDYEKQPNGSWKRLNDGQAFTDQQLADEIAPQHPDLTKAEVLEYIQKPGHQRVTSPKPGFEDDIMGSLKGTAQQSDIDALAAMAGLLVEVRPGDAVVNKWGSRQNLAVIKTEDVFAPAGGMTTLEGLYAVCIDRASGTPQVGDVFDVAPRISSWNGFEVRDNLQSLLEYIDANELFCPEDGFAQSVVWRLTNNASMSNENVTTYLQDAGIDVGYRDLDFPRLSNPNFADDESGLLTPPQLFVPGIVIPAGEVANLLETLSLEASLSVPSSNGISPLPNDLGPVFGWSLDAPDASSVALGQFQGSETSFTPDVRGFYDVTLRVDLADSLTGVPDDGFGGTFRQERTLRIIAADALVETFESGALEDAGPFLWQTGTHPWTVTDGLAHTGNYAAVSAPIGDGERSTLQARFEQLEAGPLSFSYRLFAHFTDSLLFSVDGVVRERWNGGDPWTIVTVDLPAGVHTVAWTYIKDGAESIGADRVWLDDVFFPTGALFTSIEDEPDPGSTMDAGEPPIFKLNPNHPNPFTASTTITYEISEAQDVELSVFDALGRKISVLANGYRAAGIHDVQFLPGSLAAGIYFFELRSGHNVVRRRMVLVR